MFRIIVEVKDDKIKGGCNIHMKIDSEGETTKMEQVTTRIISDTITDKLGLIENNLKEKKGEE